MHNRITENEELTKARHFLRESPSRDLSDATSPHPDLQLTQKNVESCLESAARHLLDSRAQQDAPAVERSLSSIRDYSNAVAAANLKYENTARNLTSDRSGFEAVSANLPDTVRKYGDQLLQEQAKELRSFRSSLEGLQLTGVIQLEMAAYSGNLKTLPQIEQRLHEGLQDVTRTHQEHLDDLGLKIRTQADTPAIRSDNHAIRIDRAGTVVVPAEVPSKGSLSAVWPDNTKLLVTYEVDSHSQTHWTATVANPQQPVSRDGNPTALLTRADNFLTVQFPKAGTASQSIHTDENRKDIEHRGASIDGVTVKGSQGLTAPAGVGEPTSAEIQVKGHVAAGPDEKQANGRSERRQIDAELSRSTRAMVFQIEPLLNGVPFQMESGSQRKRDEER